MAIKKFGPNSTSEEWVTLGEDITNEVIDIDVEEQLNQSFSATLTFDIDSEIGNSITYNDILVMPTNNIIDGTYSEEPFRVKKINKDIEYIEIYAEHRAFDIADNFIEYCLIENKPCTIACKEIVESTVSPHDITIESTIAGNGNIEIEDTDPMTALIGEENSIMATYDADIMFHENTITMLAERGEDRGVVIEYGRNLTGIDYTEDFTDTYTRIIATANSGEISLPEQYYDSPKINNYPHPIIRKIDFNEIKIKSLSSGKSKLSYEFISQEDGEVTFEVQLGKFGSGYKIHEVGIESVTIKNKDSNSSDDTNLITNGDFSNGLTDWTLVGISDAVVRRTDSTTVLPIDNTTKSSQGSYSIKHHHIPIVKGATYSVSFTLNSTIERQVQVIINSANKAYINETVTIGSENDREGCESLVEAQNELRNRCEKLFTEDKVDEPTLTISVNLALLSTTEEYKNFSFEKMWVGDTVTVKYQKINLETSARCINTHFNPITKEVTELTIGTEESYFSNSVSDSIKDDKNLTDKIENIVNSDKVTVDTHAIVKEAVDKATAVMNNGLGGYVVKTRDELLVMDTDDVNTAKVITRMNKNGIAVSTTGYGGPWYGLVTGGKLVVNEATTEKFTAALINAGILKSVDGSSWFNLEDGTFSWANGQLTFDGTEFIVKIGDQTINDALDSVFNIVVNKEHQIITLDTNSFPIDNGNYSFTFTVLKGNTTTETPCIINRITPSTEIDGVSFTFKNNTCTMKVDKTKRFLGITGDSFDVELEVLDYILHKTISWSTVLQGRDGKDGVNGTNGISSYFHVKYSPVANPTREQMSEEVNTYIGTYVDNIEEDSTDPESYTWVKLIGSDGLNGTDGIPGTNGTDGKTTYLHIKYSDDMVSFTDNNGETPGKYMGQYVDFIETDSLVFNDYIWAQIKGNDGRDGVDGTNGTPGVSSYFHVKYAPNNNPTASQMTDTPQEYMGTYVDSNRADSTNPKKYTWIKVLGKDGTSISIDYTVETLPTTGEVGKYYYVTGTGILWRYEESGWVELGKIQGPQGIPGTNGEDGRTQYLHIKYSNDNGATFTTNNGEDVGMYIGTYVDFEESDSDKVSDYKWARIKGTDGTSASLVKIVETSRLFTMSQGTTEYSPSSISLTPMFTNCTFGKWQYSTNGGSSWTNVTNGLNGLTISNGVLSISNTSALYTDSITSVSFKVTASDGSSDVTTITRLKDGVDGTDGTDGKNGTNGVSATNIILGNENHTFQATSDGKAVETSISFNIDGYVGTTEKAVTIGTISNIPTGMTITKNGSGTTNASLTVKVTTSMTKLNGIVTIPCTCNGLTINKQFTYSLSVPGKDGEDGINGTNGINGTSSYFHIKYAPNGNPTSAQMTETPNLYIGTYVDQSPTDSTDPKKYTWSKFQGVDGNNGKDGTPGKDGKDGTTYYLHIKYSNDGKTFTSNSGETPGDYLGQYVDTTKADSNDFSKYTWKRIKGDQGIPGADGSSSYFHIKYSSVASPATAAQMTETPSDYIGTYVDDNPTDSTDPKKYTWSRFRGQDGNKGEQGTPGINGKDGKTYYLHIKYSNDGKTFTSNNGEDPGAWLGQYVDTTAADSTTFSKYTWSKIRGDDGANASYVNITATSQVFLLPKGSTSYTPSTIKLTPTFTNSTYSKWQYSTNNGSSWTNVTSGSNGLTISSSVLTIANTCNLFTSSVKSLQFKVIGTNGATDTMTVVRVADGVDGNDGATGANGTSATNVQLSNENHTFQATSNGKAVASSITVNIYGYTGTTLKSVTIGDIVGTPTGMTITKNSSGSTSASLSIATTTSMTTKSGTITIPLTCNGITFNKIFTYSLAVPGTNGTNASYVTAEPTTLFFKRGSHDTSYSPSTITITPVFTNCSYSSWQYSKDGGSSWTTVTSGSDGLTISSYKLTIANTSSLFTDSVTSIAFKVTSNNGKSDVVTISRLSDGATPNYNLITNSSFLNGTTGWILQQPNVSLDTSRTLNGHPSIKSEQSGNTSNVYKGCYTYNLPSNPSTFNKGQKLTYSCYYYIEDKSTFDYMLYLEFKGNNSSGTLTTISDVRLSPSDLVEGSWTRVYKTVTLTETYTECRVLARPQRNGTVWFTDFKLEEGELTSWLPTTGELKGVGLGNVTNYYLATSKSTGITTSTSGWSTTIPSMTSTNKYLWNYELLTYTDGSYTTTDPGIIGIYGDKGATGSTGASGNGIKSITEYYLVSTAKSGVTTSTSGWSTTVPTLTSTNKYLWNYESTSYTNGTTSTGTPKVIGVYGDKGATGATGATGAAGKDSVNILLSNENHTFAASSKGSAVAATVTTNVIGYVGTKQTACTIGTISGLPTGMTSSIGSNGTTAANVTFTVTTSLNTKNGVVSIPVTCGGVTITKYFTYSLAIAGTNGSNSVIMKINATTNVFKSNDGGVTFSPSTITLSYVAQHCTFSKWQYSTNGGSSWTDVVSGNNGLTISSNSLKIAQSSSLYNTTVTAVTFRAMSTTSNIYDTLTVYKLYDRTDINDAFEDMTLTVTQSNEKWEAAFKNSNANNMFLNSDFKTGTFDDWIDNGGGISVGTVSAFPFYGNTEYYLRTSFPNGVRYAHDVQLEPNTDYVYEGYIYVNASLTGSNATPLNFWIWKGTTPTSTRLCTIVDYRQTLTSGRFVKCYVHFKTDNVTEALYGRFFVYHNGTASRAGAKRMSLKKGTVETEWTQHPNEVKSIVTSIDQEGVKVKHSESGTYTQMDSQGFSIRDSATGDVFTWLSSKEQWTELKVDKVFANNVENLYEGPGNLYIDHSAKLAGDGSADKPFNSFKQLAEYLQATPVINKDIYITVRDPGFVINEQLRLDRLKGTGFIKITLEGKLVIANAGSGQYCIRLHQISKWVWIVSGREFGSSTTGAVLQDGGNGDGHGIYATDVDRLEVNSLTIACKNWGIHTERTHLYTWHIDFGKCYCAVELEYQSIYYSSDDVGSCVDFCRIKSGSFAYWGYDGGTPHRPKGDVRRINGMHYDGGISLVPTDSPRYPTSNPTPPPSSGQIFTYTYDWTSHKTYQYQWSNWGDSDCKQGSWGYGLRGGHMFFDIATLRSQMAGTVQDGNTITLTRASSGGQSGGANVYINGSTCSSANGTPSYGGQTHLGTLAWGETKTFTLPKAIVQGLVSGSYNSLAVYVNSTASDCYLNIVNCSITLKTKK